MSSTVSSTAVVPVGREDRSRAVHVAAPGAGRRSRRGTVLASRSTEHPLGGPDFVRHDHGASRSIRLRSTSGRGALATANGYGEGWQVNHKKTQAYGARKGPPWHLDDSPAMRQRDRTNLWRNVRLCLGHFEPGWAVPHPALRALETRPQPLPALITGLPPPARYATTCSH